MFFNQKWFHPFRVGMFFFCTVIKKKWPIIITVMKCFSCYCYDNGNILVLFIVWFYNIFVAIIHSSVISDGNQRKPAYRCWMCTPKTIYFIFFYDYFIRWIHRSDVFLFKMNYIYNHTVCLIAADSSIFFFFQKNQRI